MRTAICLAVLALAGCGAESSEPLSEVTATRQTVSPPGPTVAPEVTKFVPDDIAPGDYLVEVEPSEESGYFEVCADFVCQPGSGMLQSNFMLAGSNAVMVVPTIAVNVKTRALKITPIRKTQ
jgi:hypothetical protein